MADDLSSKIPAWLKSLYEMENELRDAVRNGLILRNEKATEHLAGARHHLDEIIKQVRGEEPPNGPRDSSAQRGRGVKAMADLAFWRRFRIFPSCSPSSSISCALNRVRAVMCITPAGSQTRRTAFSAASASGIAQSHNSPSGPRGRRRTVTVHPLGMHRLTRAPAIQFLGRDWFLHQAPRNDCCIIPVPHPQLVATQ